MNADIITSTSHPHGTTQGFRQGCHGSHCPAPVACRDVHTRYQGDFAFRRAVDAGEAPAEIVAREEEAARAAAAAAKAKTRRPRAMRIPRRGKGTSPGVPFTPHQKQVWDLVVNEKLTDSEIAVRLGKTRDQVCASRKYLRLPANREPRRRSDLDDTIREMNGQGLDDITIAERLGKRSEYVNSRRRKMGLARNPHARFTVDKEKLARLHAEGLTDREIGERLGVPTPYIGKRRRLLGLAPNQAPASTGASSSHQENT